MVIYFLGDYNACCSVVSIDVNKWDLSKLCKQGNIKDCFTYTFLSVGGTEDQKFKFI